MEVEGTVTIGDTGVDGIHESLARVSLAHTH